MRWIRRFRYCLMSAVTMSGVTTLAEDVTSRGLAVESRNDSPSSMVRVSVDHADHVYHVGDELKAKVRSEADGYLYLFYIDSNDKVAVVFPNNIQRDNLIQKNRDIEVPSAESTFRFRVTDPPGEEVLKAVVSRERLDHLEAIGLTKASFSEMSQEAFRQSEGVVGRMADKSSWAEHSIPIRVYGSSQQPETTEHRHLISVGIGTFKDSSIPALRTPKIDALKFAEVMQQRGNLSSSRVLIDEAATYAAVQQAITVEACEVTRPGDTVFIYWSGHGTTISDTNGDESDGYDECLFLYDTSRKSLESLQQTMLIDDCFGRWIQQLDGRKVILILDACHSGGQSVTGKGIEDKSEPAFGFLDNELVRAKDIGQSDLAMITSSDSDQLSFERPDGLSSVMTWFLLKQMNETTMVDVDLAYENLSVSVPEFVKENIPGASPQVPQYLNQLSKPVLLIP